MKEESVYGEGLTPPEDPHLAVVDGETGTGMGIPIGSMMAIVTDPTDLVRGVLPLILLRVSVKRLDFKCACGNGKCNRVYSYRAAMTGHHPNVRSR